MKRRNFIKSSAIVSTIAVMPILHSFKGIVPGRIRSAHIGVGGMMGMEDLKAISSHPSVDVTALCDVDSNYLDVAHKMFPNAKVYKDYRVMLKELENEIDAVISIYSRSYTRSCFTYGYGNE